MKTSVAALIALAVGPVWAGTDDVPVNSASELREWCKQESEAAIIGQGVNPFNWSASFWEEGNTLVVKGSWRIDSKDAEVDCRVARGASRKFATVSIHDPK